MQRTTIKTIAHMVLVPGTIVAIPAYFALLNSGFTPHPLTSAIGGLLVVFGIWVEICCAIELNNRGEGSPNPLDPPKFLVRGGPYRYCRNPIYLCVGLILLGEALIFHSPMIASFGLLFMVLIHIEVVFYEEPSLRKQFGDSYQDYCENVPRWLPAPTALLQHTRPSHAHKPKSH